MGDRALEALKRIDDAQDIPKGVEVGEIFVEEFRIIRDAFGQQQAREMEALGFGYTKACSLLDKGQDPRQVEVPELIDEWFEANPEANDG